MNRHHDPNPFDEEDEEIVNPFSKGGGRVPAASRPVGFGQSLDATVDIPLDTINDSSQKQRKLADWEAELSKKEMDIKRREDAIANFHAQKLQYLAFASWLGIVMCLVFNVIATMVCWIKGGGVKIFFLATIYALMGCPLSYVVWYRPLYRAMSLYNWYTFYDLVGLTALEVWLVFLHLLDSHWLLHRCRHCPAHLFPGKVFDGVLAAIDVISDSLLAGIFYFIGFGLFCLESLLSLWVLQKIYLYFRGNK
ncbi:hypothetical protein HID58_018869 [Brassica napus]|uniref:Secretory carrier-associated membrane protein n=1 Tax=Brassica napus TaxID=3708 RepID=A0ABQ8DBM0_BRANA|nr:hypothetical protein HID58_018869 [Brassica napus]